MAFCPSCGSEVSESDKFCPSCGTVQGQKGYQAAPPISSQQQPQTVRVTTGHQYDGGVCFVICCCLSPVAALIYYLLTDHPETMYQKRY